VGAVPVATPADSPGLGGHVGVVVPDGSQPVTVECPDPVERGACVFPLALADEHEASARVTSQPGDIGFAPQG
jgi:hypothetical protein